MRLKLTSTASVRRALIFALLNFVLAFSACTESKLPEIRAILETPSGAEIDLTLETAKTNAERAKGLMFRKHLEDKKGMIFLFNQEIDHHFWMKNTYISLDLLYLDSNLKVVGIVEKLTPLSEESRGVGVPNKYVVELPAGNVAKYGIKVGSVLKINGELPQAED